MDGWRRHIKPNYVREPGDVRIRTGELFMLIGFGLAIGLLVAAVVLLWVFG